MKNENENEKEIPDGIQVEKSVISEGSAGFHPSHPTPVKLQLVCDVIVYSNTGLVTLVSGTDIFTGFQSKAICFILGAAAIVAGVVAKVIGVKPK